MSLVYSELRARTARKGGRIMKGKVNKKHMDGSFVNLFNVFQKLSPDICEALMVIQDVMFNHSIFNDSTDSNSLVQQKNRSNGRILFSS